MQRVLVTGGSGTLGRAMTRHLLANTDAIVCIYSRGELAQADMRAQIPDPDNRVRWFVGDVRDVQRLRRAMEGCDVVISAAALKRIEVGFWNPCEMTKTNVLGAINVIEAAHDAGVKKVIGVSTDKAFQPVSAYGYSKAMAESLFLNANNTRGANGPIYACVRYGNIWCSNGSVIPKWKVMIAGGATKVPVTDPDCTRFFMRIEEAVALILNTVETMRGGEVAIPELPAYRLGDVVEALGVGMEVTGLPAHEKKAESMCEGRSSEDARRMTVDELREALRDQSA